MCAEATAVGVAAGAAEEECDCEQKFSYFKAFSEVISCPEATEQDLRAAVEAEAEAEGAPAGDRAAVEDKAAVLARFPARAATVYARNAATRCRTDGECRASS